MSNYKDKPVFASEDLPLRCSAVPNLFICNLKVVSIMYGNLLDESGQAADTGSATHKAAFGWHNNGFDFEKGVSLMKENFREYPKADLVEAERFFLRYTEDPRNRVKLFASEKPVEIKIPPSSKDPTGRLIVIRGTLDQIREENGLLKVWDVKTGNRDVGYMDNFYSYQLACYVLAARETFKKDIIPGGFIRTKGYFTRGASLPSPNGVFVQTSWTVKHLPVFVNQIQRVVAAIRRGEITHSPGDHCGYCPFGGVGSCIVSPCLKGN